MLLANAITFAQNKLVPAKASFEKQWLKDGTYRMIWYAVKDTSKIEIGKVTTQVITNDKNVTVVSQVEIKNMNAPWIDSTVADIVTLKPVYHSSYNMQRDMVLHFGKVVEGFYNDKMKMQNTSIKDTTNEAYFDSNLYPVLVGWLPLGEGYEQDISIYDYNPSARSGVLKASVDSVKSGHYLTKKSGNREIWIVSVSDELGGDGTSNSTYYFDKADRKLWKEELNAGGRQMTMEAVE